MTKDIGKEEYTSGGILIAGVVDDDARQRCTFLSATLSPPSWGRKREKGRENEIERKRSDRVSDNGLVRDPHVYFLSLLCQIMIIP